MPEPIIQIEQISKSYQLGEGDSYLAMRDVVARGLRPWQWFKAAQRGKPFLALQDVSLNIAPGEVVGLIGRNGAGKSTLLKILSQITPPSSGKATLRGRVASLLEVGTGFHPELTGRENIFLNGAILGMTRREIKSKFDAIVAFSEIEKFIDTPVKRYSSGMYVRLAFGVAAHLEPEILLVDEVLAVGDAAFQKKCLGKMDEVVHQGGRTIVFVSHNMAAVQKLCPRSVLLTDGQVAADGPTAGVIRQYLDYSASQGADIDLRNRPDRKGNGAIRFTGIRLQNGDGQTQGTFVSGQNIRLELPYEAQPGSETMKNILVSVGINNQVGDRVLFGATDISGLPFDGIPQRGAFVLHINDLPLAPGRYYMTCFVRAAQDISDWIIDAGSFDVEFGDFYGTGKLPPDGQGHILLRHNWSLHEL